MAAPQACNLQHPGGLSHSPTGVCYDSGVANNPWDRSPRACQREACGRAYTPRKVWQRFCSQYCRTRTHLDGVQKVRREAFWAHHAEVVRKNAGPIQDRMRDYQTPDGKKGQFLHVPEELRPLARQHLARLLERARSQGKLMTYQRLGSLYACASRLALYSRPELGKDSPCVKWQHRYKMFRYYRRMTAEPATPAASRSLREGPRTNDPQKLLDGV